MSTKLIILRGPSGSGKTTTAKWLFDEAKTRTVLIEQDYYRFIFNPPGGGQKPNSEAIHRMLKNDVLIALEEGYDVILEGILSMRAYREVLADIVGQHPDNNYAFYFKISFDETARRHQVRQSIPPTVKPQTFIQDQKRHERLQQFDAGDMREWYDGADASGYAFERVIDESSSAEQTLALIKSECGLE